jgi:hypothetical protein
MMNDTITCSNCGAAIELNEALTSQLKADVRRQFDQERKAKEEEFAKRDQALLERQRSIEAAQASLDERVQAELAKERQQLIIRAKEQAKADVAMEFQDQAQALADAKEKLAKANQAELTLRKEKRDLEEARENLKLTLARQLDEERGKIRAAAIQEADRARELKEAEKEKVIADLRQQINELQRKSEQGSQQLQGEVMELSLEEQLRRMFPLDLISPVPKGIHGGDVVHAVHDGGHGLCGTILWESKRTKNWSDGWLAKLRDDQRAAKAQLAILVSVELPAGITTFGQVESVWICGWQYAVPLASALRNSVIQLASANRALEGRQDKMELLYQYLSGSEFKHRVEGIVEAFVTLKEELDKERRAMERIWSRREKQLDRAVLNTAGLYGDLQGIVGASLPEIEKLQLTGSSNGDVDEEIAPDEDAG